MIFRPRVALTLLAALLLLAFPAVASAVDYTVDSTGDQEDASPGTGGCATSVATCTLRAAIEESNASTSVTDKILFSSAFDGELADSTIAVGFALPDIEDEVTIDGDANGQCETDAGVDGPCVGVKGESRFEVQADEVTIDGLAITDSQIAITVEGEEFEAHDNWIGVELDGTDGPGEQSYGIFVAPHADHAVIGGTADAERNVFGNTNSALLLRGSSFGTVQGNYFGVGPDGTTTAPNGRNLVVANKLEVGSEVEATDNQIGADVGEAGTATAACDFGCNVFAAQVGATAAVNLVGTPSEEEGPATGPTQVEGNYVGLDATGNEVANGATFDVLVGSAGGVTVGGEENSQANYIVGGGTGIYHQDGEGFAAVGNVIGDGPTAADVKAPGLGMFVYCLELGTESVEAVTVSKNVFDMEGGKGIEQVFGNAEIEDNFIEGAELGIFTKGDPPGAGNLIKGNVIGESTANGILIESDFNNVLHNSIYGSGEAGVRIQDPIGFPLVITTGNLVGGDSAAEENTIRESGDDAIQIVDESGNTEEDSQNTVARNKGDSNAGRFISLIGDPNGGIEPPQISSAGKTEASGTAEPFALVRVFRKASAENGELAAFSKKRPPTPAATGASPTRRCPAARSSPRLRPTPKAGPRNWRTRRRRRPIPRRRRAAAPAAAAVAAVPAARPTTPRPWPRSPKPRRPNRPAPPPSSSSNRMRPARSSSASSTRASSRTANRRRPTRSSSPVSTSSRCGRSTRRATSASPPSASSRSKSGIEHPAVEVIAPQGYISSTAGEHHLARRG
jgi:CSLREA domain-containing protein